MADVVTKQYVWGLYLDECVQEKVLVDTNGFSADETLYPLQDLLYRTTALTDSSGVVREAYDTDAYGNTLIFRKSGAPPAAIAFGDSDTQVNNPTCPFLFTGQRWDAETSTYYYKFRQYIPGLGRFSTKDPVEHFPYYTYAESSPTLFTDPLGLFASVGTFDVSLQAIPGASLWNSRATISWNPPASWMNGPCPCNRVRLYQIADTSGTQAPKQRPWHNDRIQIGAMLYTWSQGSGLVAEPINMKGHITNPMFARVIDDPGLECDPYSSPFTQTLVQQFETCAVCMDRSSMLFRKVFGCIQWSIGVRNNSKVYAVVAPLKQSVPVVQPNNLVSNYNPPAGITEKNLSGARASDTFIDLHTFQGKGFSN